MEIGTYLRAIAAGYTMTEGLQSEGHRLLRQASDVIKPLIPAGLVVEGSGGKGTPTFTPWIGILDPDEATDPGNGIYIFYMFKRELNEVVLTLNQGITELSKRIGYRRARPLLRESATLIRTHITSELTGLNNEVDFGKDRRQAGYAAGNIVAKSYQLAEMPAEKQLVHDLRRMVRLYQQSIDAKKELLLTKPGAVATASPPMRREPGESAGGFKPKDRDDYFVQLKESIQQRRADRHELLLTDYANLAMRLGHQVTNQQVHPRDLILEAAGRHWLVEAKVVYNGNTAQAVRAAIGQLMEYAHVIYKQGERPGLMALFTEPIGGLYIELLESLNIASVWKGPDGWQASPLAIDSELV